MYVVCLTTDTDIEAIEESEVYRCFDVSNGICTSKYGKGIIENTEEYRNIIKTGSISYITRDLVDKFECIDSDYVIKGVLFLYTVYYVGGGVFVSRYMPENDLVFRRNGNSLEVSDMVITKGIPRWIPLAETVLYMGDMSRKAFSQLTLWDFHNFIENNIKSL